MKKVKLVILGDPKPLKRHRFNGYRTYDPSAKDKKIFGVEAGLYKPKKPFTGPIEANICFYMQIPKSFSKKKRKQLIGRHHYKRPDSDNLLKFVFDALVGFYDDDAQICVGSYKKEYSLTPRTVIELKQLDD